MPPNDFTLNPKNPLKRLIKHTLKETENPAHTYSLFSKNTSQKHTEPASPTPYTSGKEAEDERSCAYCPHHSYDVIIQHLKSNYSLYTQKANSLDNHVAPEWN